MQKMLLLEKQALQGFYQAWKNSALQHQQDEKAQHQ